MRSSTLPRALAAAVAVCLVASACGGKSGGGTANGTSTSSSGSNAIGKTGTAAAGTTLTFGEQQAPPSLNPGTLDYGLVDFTMLAYEPLFYAAPDGTIEPGLASSWKYAGSGNTELDVTIRSGAKFSDGSAVTAQAVVNSLNYAKNGQGDQAHYLAGATITATGAQTLSIKLTSANPILPLLLSQEYSIGEIIGPKGLANPASLTATGTSDGAGPYIFQPAQSVSGDHYTYTANPAFYDKSQQHFQKIVARVVSNEQTAVNALETGQIDVYKGDFTSAASAKSAGLQLVSMPSVLMGLNLIDRAGTVAKPLGNVLVRQAINYAIDRKSITTALFGSYGAATDETVVPGGDGYVAADADYYPYDPTKAKQLLAQAGYPNGFTMNVLAASFVGFNTMAEAIAGQLAKVGITLKVTVVSDFPSWTTDQTDKAFPAVSGGNTEEPMYLEGLDFFMPGSALFNGFGSSSATLTTLFNQAASADTATRATLDQQIEDYLVKNAWFAPVTYSPVMYYASSKIGGVQVSAGTPFASPLAWYELS